ncbi:MAG: hypothetical protein HC921_04460 [Synechococcaceae cyanobacterium SM2_3_1]|nr:hypothetical protein [Synechococcaceae cyanobacterium SM2_3_1]
MIENRQSIQDQANQLQDSIDRLQVAIEGIPERIVATLLAAQEVQEPVSAHQTHDSFAEHVDDQGQHFLLKEEPSRSAGRQYHQDFAPEAQVQRLTAQLTAAYNRIAALEEQLLAQRMHHQV